MKMDYLENQERGVELGGRIGDDILSICDELISTQTPNLLRVHLNPWVTQTCLTLNHYAQSLCRFTSSEAEDCPSFLCNSRDEALSGAIKLARYTINARSLKKRTPAAIIVDPHQVFPHFGYSLRSDGATVQFVPGIIRCDESRIADALRRYPNAGIVVLAHDSDRLESNRQLRELCSNPDVVTIQCIDAATTTLEATDQRGRRADIVVFNESFVDHGVAFSAFTTRKSVYLPWMNGRMSMFHSTTFQPNSLTTMLFMRCLEQRDPRSCHLLADELNSLTSSVDARHSCYQRFYSPSLSKLIRTIGFDKQDLTASGHSILVGSRKVFDAVAGVACSLRGHNPTNFVEETRATLHSVKDLAGEVCLELAKLSGLQHHVPAVSGASAVEHALQLGLSVQPRRPYVLALQGGFGGKTLVALTGTSKDRYKRGIGPLYEQVIYVDPFSPAAVDNISKALRDHAVGVVQLELIQGVGGVRAIPATVIEAIQAQRKKHDFLLFVDEVQTGMFRTGPFLRSIDVNLKPDIQTIGKGTSDTMFPFAATLFNDVVYDRLQQHNPQLLRWLSNRYTNPVSYAALLNTLRRAEAENWEEQVRHQGQLFQQGLHLELQHCRNIRDVRVFGMLIGIELDQRRFQHRVLGSKAAKLFSLAMLNSPEFPLLMGFCQYEPHIFKLTPGLLMQDEEIQSVCRAIGATLKRSPFSVMREGFGAMMK